MGDDPRRSLSVPAGWVERSGYVPACRVELGDTRPMSPDTVKAVHDRLAGVVQAGAQSHPLPKGWWETGEDGSPTFVVADGRHRVIAYLLLGLRQLLVCWNEPEGESGDG